MLSLQAGAPGPSGTWSSLLFDGLNARTGWAWGGGAVRLDAFAERTLKARRHVPGASIGKAPGA